MTNHWRDAALFDRLDHLRPDDAAVARLWADAVVLRLGARGTFPVVAPGSAPRLDLVAAEGPYVAEEHWLLGRDGARTVFATVVDDAAGVTIRDVGAALTPLDLELVSMAVAMGQWHRLEPRCPQCGSSTSVRAAGSSRWCAACERDLFPRTDPAVIVAVVDEADRILLGHQKVWPASRFSVLAGFVEAGESLEQAVHREILEESGVELTDVTYVASQPWPFPRSIMLGFRARAVTTEVAVDGDEIVEARWFTRAELRDAVAAGSVSLPGEASIAHRLISGWLAEG